MGQDSEATPKQNSTQIDKQNFGYIEVADEVISIVVSLAAQDVPGVVRMSTGFREGISKLLGKSNLAQGVRVRIENDRSVSVFVYVVIEYGIRIPEIGLKIQERVKQALENMTEYDVNFVDVHVEGVERRKKSELEMSLDNIDRTDKGEISWA